MKRKNSRVSGFESSHYKSLFYGVMASTWHFGCYSQGSSPCRTTNFNNKYMLEKQQLIELGFHPLDHFTVGDVLMYELYRNVNLSVSNLGTPNEMVFICESDKDRKKVTDIVVLHNYDYDGYLTLERLKVFMALKK